MKIACLYSGTTSAAWSVADGLVTTLRRMGHEVADYVRARPGYHRVTLEELNRCDLILMSGPEHILRAEEMSPFNKDEISMLEWRDQVKVPKAFWFHESLQRDDYSIQNTEDFARLLSLGDFLFFPAAQDAEFCDQEHFARGRSFWLPFGVDTEVFSPAKCDRCWGQGRLKRAPLIMLRNPTMREPIPALSGEAGIPESKVCEQCLGTGFMPTAKTVGVGFIGMLYGKRMNFIHQLATHLKQGPAITVGSVAVQDIEGVPWEEMARRLAQNYRRISVFLNFPHLSRLLVTKVYEVMACGTLMVTPMLEGPSEANCDVFEHLHNIVYYNPANLALVRQRLAEMMEKPKEREAIAASGLYEVREKHNLEKRLRDMIDVVFKGRTVGENQAVPKLL